ncbi:hypothetical protein ABZP36_027477 [Zizania latifolia]
MIKRRYFRQDHGDNSGSSSSSSGSDSDREPAEEAVAGEEVDEEEQDEGQQVGEGDSGQEQEEALEPPVEQESSGYQSEDSSGNDLDGPCVDSDEHITPRYEDCEKALSGNADSTKGSANTYDTFEVDFTNCILKCKSVYKCKLCPRIICLNEEMVRVHLKSKRHARSKKLLDEGRLKLMLNSDGELQEEQETHAERHARTIALAQVFALISL